MVEVGLWEEVEFEEEDPENYRCRVCGEISLVDLEAVEAALLCDDCFDQELVARMHQSRDLEVDLTESPGVRVARSGRGWMCEIEESGRTARFLATDREELTQLGVDILREAATLYTSYTFRGEK